MLTMPPDATAKAAAVLPTECEPLVSARRLWRPAYCACTMGVRPWWRPNARKLVHRLHHLPPPRECECAARHRCGARNRGRPGCGVRVSHHMRCVPAASY